MPSCRPDIITPVVQLVMRMKPRSILDVGVGFGKWGALFREYLEIWQGRYKRKEWQVRIDGLEPWKPYHESPLYEVYDNIYDQTIGRFISYPGEPYDVIFMAEVVEHLEEKAAKEEVLPRVWSRVSKGVVITSPVGGSPQGTVFGNHFEKHQSSWRQEDFMQVFKRGYYSAINNRYGLFWAMK